MGKEGKEKCDYYRYLYSMRVACYSTVIQIRVLLMDPDRHIAERTNTQTNFKSFSHTKFLGTKSLCAIFLLFVGLGPALEYIINRHDS